MKFLVTGGSGFIGTNVVNFLLDRKFDVLSIDILPPVESTHLDLFTKCDIHELGLLEKIFQDFRPDYVIHLAARTDLDGVIVSDYSSNTIGVENLCKVVSSTPSIKKVLFASSMLVCDVGYTPTSIDDFSPSTSYGESKVLGEKIVRSYVDVLPDFVIARPTSIWGPWFNEPYRNFFDMVLSGRFIDAGPKLAKKTYGYVDNICGQIISLVTSNEDLRFKLIYLGDEKPIDIRQWGLDIALESGLRKPFRVPFFFVKIGAFVGDYLTRLGLKFPLTSFRLKNMTTDNVLDCSVACKLNKFNIVNYKVANQKTLKWLKK